MAEQERKTKAERREEKRQRRMEEEAAAAAAQKRQTIRNAAVGAGLVAVIGGLAFLAVGNLNPTIENAITVAQADIDASREANGCEVLALEPIASREHIEPATAPPQEVLYVNGRPTATGDHELETWSVEAHAKAFRRTFGCDLRIESRAADALADDTAG